MTLKDTGCRAAATCILAAAQSAWAQTDPSPPPRLPNTPPAAAPATPPAAPAGQTVQITGGRESDADLRRQSTTAKIVIGREVIDKFGDATIGEVLRQLPGVTTPGAPGRGGPPRLRGLGGGFTRLLIDGQRVPPGFSLEQLTPEQVERIEILRAPTAETGARAIAGTINIFTREGLKRRLNDLRIGMGYENGKFSPGVNWSHNDNAGDLNYKGSAAIFRPRRENGNYTRTQRRCERPRSGRRQLAQRHHRAAHQRQPHVAAACSSADKRVAAPYVAVRLPESRVLGYYMEPAVAIVVPKPGQALCEATVLAHCARHPSGFKAPTNVMFAQTLHKNPSGKLLERSLRLARAGALASGSTGEGAEPNGQKRRHGTA